MKTAQLWEGYLKTFPKIDAAFFRNDDMALAAADVVKAHGRTSLALVQLPLAWRCSCILAARLR